MAAAGDGQVLAVTRSRFDVCIALTDAMAAVLGVVVADLDVDEIST